jgi:penicillin amidase
MRRTDIREGFSPRTKPRKTVATIALSFIVLVGLIVGAGVAFVRWHLPRVSGTIRLPGLNAEVRVDRDRFGIPHISATDEIDAFRALGFIAAQDRLFQMDLHRRLANGELSEVFGSRALVADEIARTFGFRHYAEKLLASNAISPAVLRAAEAYCDGVNFFISTQRLPVAAPPT